MISVCITTHNGEKFIKRQLESILSQLHENDEVVVSDDGSEDKTLSIIKELKDNRIKIFHYKQPLRLGYPHEMVSRNFQNALIHCTGDYIFLSDQDDEWMPNKVQVCLQDLQTNDLVLHDFSEIADSGAVIKRLHYDGSFRSRNYLLKRGKHYGCAMAFRRSVLDYALPFPKHLMLHDYWIGILAETLGTFCYEKKPLIKYRVHQNNTSYTNHSLFYKLSYRLYTIFHVMVRVMKYKKK